MTFWAQGFEALHVPRCCAGTSTDRHKSLNIFTTSSVYMLMHTTGQVGRYCQVSAELPWVHLSVQSVSELSLLTKSFNSIKHITIWNRIEHSIESITVFRFRTEHVIKTSRFHLWNDLLKTSHFNTVFIEYCGVDGKFA